MQRQRIPFIYLSACYYCTQSVPFSQAEHKAEPIDNSGKKPQKAGTTNKTEHKKHQELHKVRDLVHFLLFVSFWICGLLELHVPEHSEKMNFVSLRPPTRCIWEHQMISDERNSNREVPLLRGHKSRARTALFQDLFGLQPMNQLFLLPLSLRWRYIQNLLALRNICVNIN